VHTAAPMSGGALTWMILLWGCLGEEFQPVFHSKVPYIAHDEAACELLKT
jgi:hypothetical protein